MQAGDLLQHASSSRSDEKHRQKEASCSDRLRVQNSRVMTE